MNNRGIIIIIIQVVVLVTILLCQHYKLFDVYTSVILQLGILVIVQLAIQYKVNKGDQLTL